jgi:hypothetical protein
VIRLPAFARACLLSCLAFALCTGCSSGGSGPPIPSARGTARGLAVTATIDASGGTLVSDDGLLTVTVPPNAVATSTDFSVTTLTNTAPAGIGSGYRLGPQGASLSAPLTLDFSLAYASSTPLSALAVAYQDGSAFWLRPPGQVATSTPPSITVASYHLADWAAQTATSTLDLRGPVTYEQTIETPFSATGTAVLSYAGQDPGTYYYFSALDLAIAPVANGTSTCTASAPDDPGHTSLAQVFTGSNGFDYAINAEWHLACDDGSTLFLATQFDTFGINLFGCKRTWETTPVDTPDLVQGAMRIDCGAQGYVRATWNLSH